MPFRQRAARDTDDDVGGRLARQHDGERGRAAGFRRDQAGHRSDRDTGCIVIHVRDCNVIRIHRVVNEVCARGGRQHDGVGDVSVIDVVVDAGDGDSLGHIPVRRGEAQETRTRRTFRGVAGVDREKHVRGRLTGEDHRERGGRTGFGRRQTGDRRHGDTSDVVVRSGAEHVVRIHAVVVRVGAGRQVEHDRVRCVTVDHEVIDARDRDGLRHVPVRRREGQRSDVDRGLGVRIAVEQDGDIRDRLRVEDDSERLTAARFRGREAARRGDRDTSDIVVGVGGSDVRGVDPGEVQVGAGDRFEHDGVCHVSVHDEVVRARDRDRLRDVPVGGREGDAGRRGRALGGIAAGQSKGHVGRRHAGQDDIEGRRTTRFVRDQASRRRRGDVRNIVVGICGAHVDGVERVVAQVGAGGGVRDDRERLVPVDHHIVDARDRDDLIDVPVRGREGQCRRVDRAFRRVAARERECDVRRGHAGEVDRERGCGPCFAGGETRDRVDAHAHYIIVGVRPLDVGRVHRVVHRVGAAGRVEDHDPRLVAVDDEVVGARDSHRLRHVPVGRREGHRSHVRRGLSRVVAGKRERDVGRGLRIEHDREGRRRAGFIRGQTGHGSDRDAGHVIVGIREVDIVSVAPRVVGVAAHRRLERQRECLIAIDDEVVHTPHPDVLRDVPVRGREGDRRRGRLTLGRVRAGQRDHDVRGRLRLEHDRERRAVPRLAGHQPRDRVHHDTSGICNQVGGGELRGVVEIEVRRSRRDGLVDGHRGRDGRVECGFTESVGQGQSRAEEAFAFPIARQIRVRAGEELDPEAGTRVAQERSRDVQSDVGRSRQGQLGIVLQRVRAEVGVEGVVGGDAIAGQIDPQ